MRILGRRVGHVSGLLAAALLVASAGCTQFTPYRTRAVERDATPTGVVPQEVECFAGRTHPTLRLCEGDAAPGPGAYALQHRRYEYTDYLPNDARQTRNGDYHLAFVEFDDQGWFADRKQMEALFMLLHRLEREEKQRTGLDGHALILLYAHGWKHNAGPCDNNVICFSRLLERMDILERNHREVLESARSLNAPERRPIVGVYVGWRGLSLGGGPLANVTFWTRKAAAERVGRGGVKELLTRLNDYRRVRNPAREPDKTQLVIAGHSFGGQVVYSALSHSLMERASTTDRFDATTCSAVDPRRRKPDGLACYDTATSFGDLVILVNPAFEGSAYEPLFHVATNRCYGDRQRPVMMTVTSSADAATGVAFPLGRALNTLLEHRGSPEQGASMRQTVGHDDRYTTHALKWARATKPESVDREPAPEERQCGCPYLEPTTTFNWRKFVGGSGLKQWSQAPAIVARRENGDRAYPVYNADVQLVGDRKYQANYPYLVVTADPEIIPDHNSIYGEPFVRFLHAFFLLHVAAQRPFEADGCLRDTQIDACSAGGPMPCESSCRLADGRSCSGRDTRDVPRPP